MTPGADPFKPKGYNLNKLGRGPQGDATCQILRLLALWFQTRRFFHVSISLYKTCNPLGGPILGPMGHYLNKLGRGPIDDASYQISRI